MGKSAKALAKLERLIWGLESFRIFDNALSSSVNEIKLIAPSFGDAIEEVKLDHPSTRPLLLRIPFPPTALISLCQRSSLIRIFLGTRAMGPGPSQKVQ